MPEDLAVLSGVWDSVSAAEELVPLPGSTSALEDGGSLAAGGHINFLSVHHIPRNPRTNTKKLAIKKDSHYTCIHTLFVTINTVHTHTFSK